jgi:hypothetical protein
MNGSDRKGLVERLFRRHALRRIRKRLSPERTLLLYA